MRQWFIGSMATLALAGGHVASAGDLGIHIMLQGEVAPGVYGQVRIGNAGPPPLVFAQPVMIVSQAAPPEPVYLHVPPDHARNWRKHCREYNACNRPVYFVRSEEYAPHYDRHAHDHDHEGDDDRNHEHYDHRDDHRDDYRDDRHDDHRDDRHDDHRDDHRDDRHDDH
jgi:hypothetical protein